MADIKFECPHCGKHLAGDETLCGRTIPCPDCKKSFSIPLLEPIPVVRAVYAQPAGAPAQMAAAAYTPPPPAPAQPAPPKPTPGKPMCQACGGEMKKEVISSGNCGGIVLALIAFCLGVILFFFLPVVGWILGPIICIGALFMGGKRSKVWKCRQCGTVINRA